MAQLPIYNKYTLRHLIAFLVEVTSHSDVNKMVRTMSLHLSIRKCHSISRSLLRACTHLQVTSNMAIVFGT